MSATSESTATAQIIAITVTVILAVAVGFAVVLYKAAQHNAAKRAEATQAEREERHLQSYERLLKELNEDDRLSLARFALWLNGLYPCKLSNSLQLFAARIPSDEAQKSTPAYAELYGNIIGFTGTSIIRCYRFGYGGYDDLQRLDQQGINYVIKRLAARPEFLALCVQHALTLSTYLDYYYDTKFGLNNDDMHRLPINEMLTQQTVDKLIELSESVDINYQTI